MGKPGTDSAGHLPRRFIQLFQLLLGAVPDCLPTLVVVLRVAGEKTQSFLGVFTRQIILTVRQIGIG